MQTAVLPRIDIRLPDTRGFFYDVRMSEVPRLPVQDLGARDIEVIRLRPTTLPTIPTVVASTETAKGQLGDAPIALAKDSLSSTTLIHELIGSHAEAMFRLAKSIVRDSALAEDVVQESLLKAWQAADSFRGESSLRSWALRITHNTAISLLRKRREDVRDPMLVPETIDAKGHTDRQVDGRMMVDELWVALGTLDPLSRSITVLREVEGMSYEEIAAMLDLPLPTVKTRLFRARKLLATALEGWR